MARLIRTWTDPLTCGQILKVEYPDELVKTLELSTP